MAKIKMKYVSAEEWWKCSVHCYLAYYSPNGMQICEDKMKCAERITRADENYKSGKNIYEE